MLQLVVIVGVLLAVHDKLKHIGHE